MKHSLTVPKVQAVLLALCVLAVSALPTDAYAFPAKDVPVLMYHKVDDVTPTIYWVSADNFRDQMFLLHDLGYETVDFEDLYAHIMDVTELPAKPVIVTFDDSYQDIYTYAFPVLNEHKDPNFIGVVHTITDWTGDDEGSRQLNLWDQPPEPDAWHLIWPELAELHDAGWAIEAHSRTHAHLSSLSYEEKVYEAESAEVIGAKLGIPNPNFYCYPFGQYDSELIGILQAKGYLGAMNASGGIENTGTTDLWHIKRIGIMRDDTLAQFASKIGETVPALPRLTVNEGSHGSVEISPDQPYYEYDEVVTLTAVAEPGYIFTGWTGDLSGSTNPETITMTGDMTVTANFAPESALFWDDFEAGSENWTNVTGDKDDWYLNKGSTPSSSTGPNHDNTIGDSTGWYIYMETSSGYCYTSGDEARLESPNIDADTYSIILSFYYHMYGSNMGTLNVDVYDGTWHNGVWSISGQQHSSSGAAYTQATVDLGAYTGTIKIRFRGVAAGGYRGDMAIDDVEVTAVPRVTDNDPPTPDPMTWATAPYATGTSSISMTAATASDASGVEYYFACVAGGGNDSEWQDSSTYEDTGLSPDTQYTYQVKARDKSINQNETGLSSSASALTDPLPVDTTPPSPDPMTWATAPYATGTSSISMTATTASDASGVEYYFACVAGGGNDSGWQDGSTYEDTGLSPDTQYTYQVKARDKSINQNETGWSSSASATTEPEDTTPPSPDPMKWSTASPPAPTGPTSILMTAMPASDTSGVEYYFECIAGGGNDSGWQDSPIYEDTGLSPDTQYTYRVKARDKSVNQNETGWSSSASATTDALPEWTELTYDDFESGWGSYTDGGKDCRRSSGDSVYAHQGTYCAKIQDNSGTTSSFYYTNGVDVAWPGYTQIKIDFWFYSRSMESGEDFWVQYYDGISWHTVASYARGTDFNNDQFYHEEVYIDIANYNFSTNMKIRFMCDASSNNDYIYIDEVEVSAK